MLGASLLGQQKYADAEALLIQGYEGMKHSQEKLAGRASVTKEAKHRLVEAGERLVQLYEAWDKPDELAKWREQIK